MTHLKPPTRWLEESRHSVNVSFLPLKKHFLFLFFIYLFIFFFLSCFTFSFFSRSSFFGGHFAPWLHFHFSLSCIGEGNGNPLQCSCLENPKDGEVWWAAVYGVAQSQTRLKWLSSSSCTPCRSSWGKGLNWGPRQWNTARNSQETLFKWADCQQLIPNKTDLLGLSWLGFPGGISGKESAC